MIAAQLKLSPVKLPRIKQWTFRLAEFGLVQGLVQLLTALAGFMIVRHLAKPEYALFAIINGMQTATNLLADLGIGIGVRSIGGRVCDDRARFGQLINTALALRRRFALVSLSICLPVTMWMLWRNRANGIEIIALSLLVAAGVFPLLSASVFSVSAQLHHEYRRMQKVELGNAAMRVGLIGVLALSRMNAWLAASVGVISNWVAAFCFRRWAGHHADLAAAHNKEDLRELKRLSLQSLPNTIFFCFQGQVTLLILTLVGNHNGIADITAIGRIAALLTVANVVFTNVLAPRFNRCQDPERLPRLYLMLVAGMAVVLAPLLLAAWLYPAPLLWLLGDKYASLQSECVWVIAANCLALLAGVMWTLNSSKAWIRLQAVGYIPIILAAQAIAAGCLDLRQFHDVLIFNLVSVAAPIPMFMVDAYVGLRRVPQVAVCNP
jgi:O-antigen/teichoic acid export membrane protein